MLDSRSNLERTSQATILKNRGYQIISKLGEGSYAKVYLAEFVPAATDQSPESTINLAVKVVETKYGPNEFVKKFLPRELNILSLINHPHIIHIHSILQIGLKFYIFMRFAEQGDLLDFIVKHGLINENQARVWTRQIALALQYLHELNIAHRDMKCENILVTKNFNVKISDFGFARYTIDSKKKPILSDTYCGSLSYASPEILHGHPYNAKISDLWSFGVIIFVMLNKSMPFDDNNPKSLYEKQKNHNFKFRTKVAPILSNEVKMLVQNLLEPDPTKRYSIDATIKSDWIAMDKRLITLSSLELAALSSALENRLIPPDNFTLPKLKIKSKNLPQLDVEVKKHESVNSLEVIKSYKPELPYASEMSKLPSNQIDDK